MIVPLSVTAVGVGAGAGVGAGSAGGVGDVGDVAGGVVSVGFDGVVGLPQAERARNTATIPTTHELVRRMGRIVALSTGSRPVTSM